MNLGQREKLGDLMSAPRAQGAAALTQAEKLMQMEIQLKLTHLKLLISLRNQHTEDQVA